MSELLSHIGLLHYLANGQDGVLVLASYGQDPHTGVDLRPKVQHFKIGDENHMAEIADQWSQEEHRNVYAPYSVMRSDLKPTSKGTEADVISVLAIAPDFDDDNAEQYGERLPLEPNYVIETSRGRFQTPYLLDRPYTVDEVKPVATALVNYVRCDMQTKDMSHVWRIPGTTNWPNKKKADLGRNPEQAHIVQAHKLKETSLDALRAALPAIVTHAPTLLLTAGSGPGRIRQQNIPVWLVERMKREPEAGEDRSETAHGVIKALQEFGYSALQIQAEIEKYPDGIGQRYVKTPGKLQSDIVRTMRKTGAGWLLDPRQPYENAHLYINAQHGTAESWRTLHSNNGQFWKWTGTHYAELSADTLRADIYAFLSNACQISKDEIKKPYQPTRTKVADMMDALKAAAHLSDTLCAPAWLDDEQHLPATDIVACQNGLLHLPTKQLHPHTPSFFSHNALAFDYIANAPEPREWLSFLKSIWPRDNESISALQEIIGYMLTTDTRQQKMFMLVGPKRSGKGTIGRVLTALLGQHNVAGPTLNSLCHQFGLAPLIGKQAAIVSDARLGTRTDKHVIAERLLSISGEDRLDVHRKYLPEWTGQLSVRFLFMTNEMPKLSDTSGALASRFVILKMDKSFYGCEDQGLTDRLKNELSGIFNWAMVGHERLKARGYFVQPESARDAQRELEQLGSPVLAFIQECCDTGPGCEIERDALYDAWHSWSIGQGTRHVSNRITFGRDLRAAVSGIESGSLRRGDKRCRVYRGIQLKQ